jgi:hypothetical protein
VDTW